MSVFKYLLILVKSWIYVVIILTVMFAVLGTSSANKGIDEAAIDKIAVIEAKFDANYINSRYYWVERNNYYRIHCPHQNDNARCEQSVNYSHEQYMEHAYGDLYESRARIEAGENGGLARFFKIL